MHTQKKQDIKGERIVNIEAKIYMHKNQSLEQKKFAKKLGNQKPIIRDPNRQPPPKRKVSGRWLAGSIVTAVASIALMGGALYITLDGKQKLSNPADVIREIIVNNQYPETKKGDRLIPIAALEPAKQKIFQVPTKTKVGQGSVITKKPFAFVSAPLAIVPTKKISYQKFDPLDIFQDAKNQSQDEEEHNHEHDGHNHEIHEIREDEHTEYSDDETEMLIQAQDFFAVTAPFHYAEIHEIEAQNNVSEFYERKAANPFFILAYANLPETNIEQAITNPDNFGALVKTKNVTTIQRKDRTTATKHFSEEVLVISQKQSLFSILQNLGAANDKNVVHIAHAMSQEMGNDIVGQGTRLRIAWEKNKNDKEIEIRRVSLYHKGKHYTTIAVQDNNQVVYGLEPARIDAVDEVNRAVRTTANEQLTAYDGIFRAAMSQGLSEKHTQEIIKAIAPVIDLKANINPEDKLEVFFSLDDKTQEPNEESEILYVGITLNGNTHQYYKFKTELSETTDYYNLDGKSAKQFLVRNPVPNGRFESAYGWRKHPISKRVKMHFGVDYAARRGTPIIAAGDGIIEKAGWDGGHGRRTIIRHANGYKTSYSHQYKISKGIKPGARVKQGQVIGQVGSTGYSTGPHLHYEIIVNKRKVNPMKIRLPEGRELKGKTLSAFIKERERLDELIEQGRGGETTLAAL